jgi:hypothetical protein
MIVSGIQNLHDSHITREACLVSMCSPRLRGAGILPQNIKIVPDAERTLYRFLQRDGGNAYGRFNALGRELVSFEHALDARLARPRI